jgi:hypothetical protein
VARTAAGPAAATDDDRAPGATDRAEAVGDAPGPTTAHRDVSRIDTAAADPWAVVDLDDVERRAVQALADFGLVPPLRHQDASTPRDRHVS